MSQTQDIELITQDATRIAAKLYTPVGQIRAKLVVAGATGVPQGFYRAFADYAASRGFETLTLDYRGIGLSAPASLRGFEMDYRDWAVQDTAAAVDWIATDAAVPLFMMGHSYGGHGFGQLPNWNKVEGFYTFASGAGWAGWMPPLERVRVWLLWNLISPVIVQLKGYLAWKKLGMGENLPLGVYHQWKLWCRFPHYFFDDPNMQHMKPMFAKITTPIVAANATDDLWALPASRDAFMSGYTGTRWEGKTIDPASLGLKAIGHMGYFKPSAKQLWAEALDWFESIRATNHHA
jgi:predicted alpha/beta hydrolase